MKNLANDICVSVNKCGCGMTLRKDKRANYTEGLDGGICMSYKEERMPSYLFF